MVDTRACVGLLAAAPLLLAPAAEASTRKAATHTIFASGNYVTSIGAFQTRHDATLRAAIRVFGRPSSRRLGSDYGCRVEWRRLRLRIYFWSFAKRRPGQTTCTPSVGKAQTFTARGRRFRTWGGLRVGHASGAIPRRHPSARFRDDSWWLLTGTSPLVGSRYPVVRAIVGGGRVRALAGFIGAAGE